MVTYLARAEAYEASGESELAQSDVDFARSIATTSEDYVNVGRVYWRLGKRQLAIQAFLDAEKVNPNHYWVHKNLARAFDRTGQYDQAITRWKKACALSPFDRDCRIWLIRALVERGHYDQAMEQMRLAIELDPIRFSFPTFKSWAEFPPDMDDRLRERLSQLALVSVQALNQKNLLDGDTKKKAKVWSVRTNAYLSSSPQDVDQAIDGFTKAIELDPENAKHYYNRGNMYQKIGSHTEALADYDTAPCCLIPIFPNA